MTSNTALRPLGCGEIFSSSRHALGIYRGLANTCRYHVPSTILPEKGNVHKIFETALREVVLQQVSLRVGIAEESTNRPYFTRIDTIHLDSHIEWTKVRHDIDLLQILQDEQAKIFPDVANRPPWKVMIVESYEHNVLDVVFFVHHAICDGRSAAQFHTHLLKALNKVSGTTDALTSRSVNLPKRVSMIPSMEEMIRFEISWPFLLKTVWQELGPKWLQFGAPSSPWAGEAVSVEPHRLHLHKLEISATETIQVISRCRSKGSTLTGLIHALILLSLSQRLKAGEDLSFVGTTPISLTAIARPPQGINLADTLSVAVTGYNHSFDMELVHNLRLSQETESDSFKGEAAAWEVARRVRNELRQRTDTLPKNDIIALLHWVSDWQNFWTSKLGKPRSSTWEVSNVGSIQYASEDRQTQAQDRRWRIDRSMFTQPVLITGAAISVNIASVAGGFLTIMIGWQEQIIEDELVNGLIQDLETWLEKIIRAGKQT